MLLKDITSVIKKIFRAPIKFFTMELFSWRVAGYVVGHLLLYCFFIWIISLISFGLVFATDTAKVMIFPVSAVVLAVHFWYGIKLYIKHKRHAKVVLVIQQFFLILIILPLIFTGIRQYKIFEKYNLSDSTRLDFIERDFFGSKGITRIGSFIGVGDIPDPFFREAKLLDKWRFKIPIIGYYLRLLSTNTFIDGAYRGDIFVREKNQKGDTMLRIYKYSSNIEDSQPFQEMILPKNFPQVPLDVISYNRYGGNNQVRLSTERLSTSNILSNNLYLIKPEGYDEYVLINPDEIIKDLNDKKISVTSTQSINMGRYFFADKEASTIYYGERVDDLGEVIAYNHDTGEVNVFDHTGEGKDLFMHKLLFNKYISEVKKEVGESYIDSTIETDLDKQNVTSVSIIKYDNEKSVNSRVLWFSSGWCQSYYDHSKYLGTQNNSGCIISDALFNDQSSLRLLDAKYRNERAELILSEDLENKVNNDFLFTNKLYVIHASSTVQEIPRIHSKYLRTGFKYTYTDYSYLGPDKYEVKVSLVSLNKPDVAYRAVYEISGDEQVLIGYYPDWNLCKSDLCDSPAALFNSYSDESDVYYAEDNYIENFFPTYPYTFNLEGTRDDVYQLVSNRFRMINIPITIGALHNYEIDLETRQDGQKSYKIRISVDNDGDGVYEAIINARDELTGYEFIDLCGLTCSNLIKYL